MFSVNVPKLTPGLLEETSEARTSDLSRVNVRASGASAVLVES
jgi:hypothetical protein